MRQPDLGPFSTNAVVRKNLLQTLMLFQSASLAKEGKIEMVTQRMMWGLEVEGVDEDSVYPTARKISEVLELQKSTLYQGLKTSP